MWPPKFSDAIDACNVARRRCERLVTAGLAQPDVNTVASVIVTARDCARIATLTSQMLERGSKYAYPLCEVCCPGLRRARQGGGETFEDRSLLALRGGVPEVRPGVQQAGESEETGPLTGAFAPEAPNAQKPNPKESPALQIQKSEARQLSFGRWGLRFALGFGVWDLGFPA